MSDTKTPVSTTPTTASTSSRVGREQVLPHRVVGRELAHLARPVPFVVACGAIRPCGRSSEQRAPVQSDSRSQELVVVAVVQRLPFGSSQYDRARAQHQRSAGHVQRRAATDRRQRAGPALGGGPLRVAADHSPRGRNLAVGRFADQRWRHNPGVWCGRLGRSPSGTTQLRQPRPDFAHRRRRHRARGPRPVRAGARKPAVFDMVRYEAQAGGSAEGDGERWTRRLRERRSSSVS